MLMYNVLYQFYLYRAVFLVFCNFQSAPQLKHELMMKLARPRIPHKEQGQSYIYDQRYTLLSMCTTCLAWHHGPKIQINQTKASEQILFGRV